MVVRGTQTMAGERWAKAIHNRSGGRTSIVDG